MNNQKLIEILNSNFDLIEKTANSEEELYKASIVDYVEKSFSHKIVGDTVYDLLKSVQDDKYPIFNQLFNCGEKDQLFFMNKILTKELWSFFNLVLYGTYNGSLKYTKSKKQFNRAEEVSFLRLFNHKLVTSLKIENRNYKDKNTIEIYNSKIFITNGILYFVDENHTVKPIKLKSQTIRIFQFLIERGKGNIDTFFTRKDISNNSKVKLYSVNSVSNSFSELRNLEEEISIKFFEERKVGRTQVKYRINPELLSYSSPHGSPKLEN